MCIVADAMRATIYVDESERTAILVCSSSVRTAVRQTLLYFYCTPILLECLFVVAKSAEDVAEVDEARRGVEGIAHASELLQFDGLVEVLQSAIEVTLCRAAVRNIHMEGNA